MSITLSAEHRDALYDFILIRLSGLGDLWPIIEREDFGEADRLGREFCDVLRLVLDDLGWGELGEVVTLTLPPEELGRIFSRLRDHAERARRTRERELAEEQDVLERAQLAVAACDRVLDALASA
jgi:hypothetical protein